MNPPLIRPVGLCLHCRLTVFSNEPRLTGRGHLNSIVWALHRNHVEPFIKQLHDLMGGLHFVWWTPGRIDARNNANATKVLSKFGPSWQRKERDRIGRRRVPKRARGPQ